jgi:hypothetical protein
VRQQRLEQMMHPSRAARLNNNNNRQGVQRSHQQQRQQQQQQPSPRRPKSRRAAARAAKKNRKHQRVERHSKNNQNTNEYAHPEESMVVGRNRMVQEVVAGAPRQPPPPPQPSNRSAAWQQPRTHRPTTGYDAEASLFRPAHSVVSTTSSTAGAAYASDATVGRDDYSSSTWNESSVAARQGTNVSESFYSTTVARAASASTALDEQNSGNESDLWRSSDEEEEEEEEDDTARPHKRRKTFGEALRQTNKKNMKQSRNERKKQKALLQQGKGVCCKNRILVPHTEALQRFVCINCSTATVRTKMLFYVEGRKTYNKQQDLVKVVARPDPATLNLIQSMQDKFHVPPEYRPNHLVLAGCMPRKNASAMVHEIKRIVGMPTLRFMASKAVEFGKQVGVKKKGKSLCLRLVETDSRLTAVLERARAQDCVLPQWPLSLVLGSYACSQAAQVARNKLNGGRVVPSLVFDSLAILDSSGKPTACVLDDTTVNVEPEGERKTKAEEPVVDCQESAQMSNPPGANQAVATDNSGQCDACTFIPHPSEREAVVCCECGQEKSARDDIVAFNHLRQVFLRDRHSLRITAKLDERSCSLMEPLADNAASTTGFCESITLVDGLMAWSIQSTSLLNDMEHAIQLSPALQIVGSRFIPTSDSARTGLQVLVIDLLPEPALDRILFEAAESSLVAQAPLCVSIGLVPFREGSSNAMTEIVKCLIGSSLFLDSSGVESQSGAAGA